MKTLSLIAALLAAPLALSAQPAPKIGGLVQVWYTQMTDSNLRNNSAAPMGYYNLRSEFKENGFNIRRVELNTSGSVLSNVDYFVMVDPSINTSNTQANSNSSYNPTILQDAFVTYRNEGLQVKLGEFKTLQTYEGNISSSELLFAERSQLGRVFGDKRDRGMVASYQFGEPGKELATKLSAGVFNGMTDLASAKAGDTNAQKDFIARLDFNLGKTHKFGAYTLQGSTDQADKGALLARTFAGTNAPTAAAVLDNKDKTTNMGVFYVYQDEAWHFSAEYITGKLGRRFASVTTTTPAPAALRDGLDQKFAGYYLTGGYKMDAHSFLIRYDFLNYNSNSDGNTASYTAVPGTDFTPKYKETTFGYTYAFNPGLVKSANIKLNYILRSKNFLRPFGTETGEQGGNTALAAFQVAF